MKCEPFHDVDWFGWIRDKNGKKFLKKKSKTKCYQYHVLGHPSSYFTKNLKGKGLVLEVLTN